MMNFGQAIEALKNGSKVTRDGWNGKGMWLVLMPELQLPAFSSQEAGAKVNDRAVGPISDSVIGATRGYELENICLKQKTTLTN